MKRRIRFEACLGGGYFYDHQDGKCPWLTKSMEVAELWLHLLIQEHDLTPQEIEMAGAEIRAAGLRKKASAEELAILFEYRHSAEFAALLDQLHAPFLR